MKEDLLKIINHYGVMPQLKHLQTEMFELVEAIMELKSYEIIAVEKHWGLVNRHEFIEHIEEEYADVTFMLEQIKEIFELDEAHIEEWKKFKCKRQLERMSKE